MSDNQIEMDFFGDGMRIFLDYISRQIKKRNDYQPHPIIRAFMLAAEGIEKLKDGETSMGVSHEGTVDNIYEPYIVVLRKHKDGIEVLEIQNIKIGKKLPVDIMITIFRLQIKLDKIEGDEVSPKQFVNALNAVIKGNRFFLLGDRWREACAEFKRLLEEGKIFLPKDSDIAEGIENIRYDTPWEEYPNNLRSLIGTAAAPLFGKKDGTVVVTTPENIKIEKYKVYDTATEILLGKSSEYFIHEKNE